jgi:hypothetical protein
MCDVSALQWLKRPGGIGVAFLVLSEATDGGGGPGPL